MCYLLGNWDNTTSYIQADTARAFYMKIVRCSAPLVFGIFFICLFFVFVFFLHPVVTQVDYRATERSTPMGIVTHDER